MVTYLQIYTSKNKIKINYYFTKHSRSTFPCAFVWIFMFLFSNKNISWFRCVSYDIFIVRLKRRSFNCIHGWKLRFCLLTFKNDWLLNLKSQYLSHTIHLYLFKTGHTHILYIFQIDSLKNSISILLPVTLKFRVFFLLWLL